MKWISKKICKDLEKSRKIVFMKILSYFLHFPSLLSPSFFRYIIMRSFIYDSFGFAWFPWNSPWQARKRKRVRETVGSELSQTLPSHVNYDAWRFYFRPNMAYDCFAFLKNTNLAFTRLCFVCERSEPNKSIFNYLLLKEINSTTRKQIRRERSV